MKKQKQKKSRIKEKKNNEKKRKNSDFLRRHSLLFSNTVLLETCWKVIEIHTTTARL